MVRASGEMLNDHNLLHLTIPLNLYIYPNKTDSSLFRRLCRDVFQHPHAAVRPRPNRALIAARRLRSPALQLINCLFAYGLQGGNKSPQGRGTVAQAKTLQTDGSRRQRMFTTLCMLLGLRVTQPWHIPMFIFILFNSSSSLPPSPGLGE